MLKTNLVFPEDFVFGVATSATQVEGAAFEDNRGLSIWDAFARVPGVIADGSTPDNACDTYHRWEQDFDLLKTLGVKSYRFSFSWPRIMPAGKGKVNQKGLDYYKRMIDKLNNMGIMPNATIYHWDLPYELEREGGWLNREVVDWYGEYASILFREFGDSVPMWATINEPIAAYVGYGLGQFAPGRRGEKSGRQANHHVLLAHGEGVRRFREENLENSKIGIVVDIWNHHPYRLDDAEDIALAEIENEKTYRSYLNPIFNGCYTTELLAYMEKNNCLPTMEVSDMKLINQPLDFFGLNCYNRVLECADSELLKKKDNKISGGNYMDNGSEYYPRAVYDALHILKNDYNVQMPIYITENGTPNCNEKIAADGKIHDQERIKYLEGFLDWINKAISEGIDVRGYYAWSLLDNWEWHAGYTYRYGLVHNNFATQERIPKDSFWWYRDLIANNQGV
jgi:beta-glucosidase